MRIPNTPGNSQIRTKMNGEAVYKKDVGIPTSRSSHALALALPSTRISNAVSPRQYHINN